MKKNAKNDDHNIENQKEVLIARTKRRIQRIDQPYGITLEEARARSVEVYGKKEDSNKDVSGSTGRGNQSKEEDILEKAFKDIGLTKKQLDELSKQEPQNLLNKTYRKMSLQYHPDKNVGVDDDRRKKINEKIRNINLAKTEITCKKNISEKAKEKLEEEKKGEPTKEAGKEGKAVKNTKEAATKAEKEVAAQQKVKEMAKKNRKQKIQWMIPLYSQGQQQCRRHKQSQKQ